MGVEKKKVTPEEFGEKVKKRAERIIAKYTPFICPLPISELKAEITVAKKKGDIKKVKELERELAKMEYEFADYWIKRQKKAGVEPLKWLVKMRKESRKKLKELM